MVRDEKNNYISFGWRITELNLERLKVLQLTKFCDYLADFQVRMFTFNFFEWNAFSVIARYF